MGIYTSLNYSQFQVDTKRASSLRDSGSGKRKLILILNKIIMVVH